MVSHKHNHARFVQLAILAAATVVQGSSVRAAVPAVRFEFVVYTNEAGGRALADGQYAAAAKTLNASPSMLSLDTTTFNTNRCVAFSLTAQLTAARVACDAAVKDSQEGSAGVLSLFRSRRAARNDAALAYSNRAVLNWLSGDAAAAARDLASARQLAPSAEYVVRNLTALAERAPSPTEVLAADVPVPHQ